MPPCRRAIQQMPSYLLLFVTSSRSPAVPRPTTASLPSCRTLSYPFRVVAARKLLLPIRKQRGGSRYESNPSKLHWTELKRLSPSIYRSIFSATSSRQPYPVYLWLRVPAVSHSSAAFPSSCSINFLNGSLLLATPAFYVRPDR